MINEERMKRLRVMYEDLTDEEIEKAQEQVDYVLYDAATGEIVQSGNMDRLAFEAFVPNQPDPDGPPLEKMIVDPERAWKLRGEFVDHDEGKYMFKVTEGKLEAKPDKKARIDERRLSRDKDDDLEVEDGGVKAIDAGKD